MINRYVALYGGVAVLFGAYAVWWHQEAERLESAFPAVLVSTLPPGAVLSRGAADVDGFPFRLNVQLADVKLAWGDGDWVATKSLTGIFQPLTGDHLILHLDAPVTFSVQGATGSLNAERGLASLVGYEDGAYQLDADTLNPVLEQPAVARMTAARLQFHVRREDAAPSGRYAFSVSVKGLTPKEAATGRLAAILSEYGEVQKDGTVNLDVDEKDNVAHAAGRPLTPEAIEKLRQEF
jgi:hypothetical protein